MVPIILALFFGNWSDRRGRKLPLIVGLLGKFIYSFMVVINSMVDTWDLNTIVYTASLPMGMLGGDVAIFGSCFAYISDISSVQQRTLRITILDVVYLSTMPTGKWNSIFYLVLKSIMILKIYVLINELWMFIQIYMFMEIWKETRLKYYNFTMDILWYETKWQDTLQIGHFMADRKEVLTEENLYMMNMHNLLIKNEKLMIIEVLNIY